MFAEFDWNEAISSSPIFLILVGCSVVTLGVIIERAYYFWKRKGNPDVTLTKVLRKLRAGDVKEALWECENSVHPLGKVAALVFKCRSQERETVEEQMQIVLSQQKMLLERNLGILGTSAAVSPLIGLLGTVWGIMRAFSDMAITGSAAPSVVAAGVAEALVTTAAGLVVAVPALIVYNYFARRMNVMLTVAENHTRSIRSVLIESETKQVNKPESMDRHVNWQSIQSSEDKQQNETPEPARSDN
jgi:biopolymer transport protein ExbB